MVRNGKYLVAERRGVKEIALEDIIKFETIDKSQIMMTHTGGTDHVGWRRLAAIARDLPASFMKTNEGRIINLDHVDILRRKDKTLYIDGVPYPIGLAFYPKVRDWLVEAGRV